MPCQSASEREARREKREAKVNGQGGQVCPSADSTALPNMLVQFQAHHSPASVRIPEWASAGHDAFGGRAVTETTTDGAGGIMSRRDWMQRRSRSRDWRRNSWGVSVHDFPNERTQY